MIRNSYFLGNQIGGLVQSIGGGDASAGQPTAIFGRVIKIALDDSTKILDAKGNQLPIGAIMYRDITTEKDIAATEYPALPLFPNQKQFPLPNEVVVLTPGPTSEIQTKVNDRVMYYSTVINIWGNINHNAIPEPATDRSTILGKEVKELSTINSLYPFPGDIILEGRQGQSIRMGGYKSLQNKLVDDSNNGDPTILISNGQIKTDNGVDHIVEDINKDPNSIYFLSNHKVNLEAANTKRSSYTTIPQASNQFKGNQIILNAGRLYLNAKEDSILLSAKESIGLNANTVNLDATDYFCLDGKKVYLGAKARTATGNTQQPAVLGKQLENWLSTLLDTLDTVASAMSSASAVGAGPVTQLNAAGPTLKATIQSLKTQFKLFKSKKVFIE
jgi:hypothetical protein